MKKFNFKIKNVKLAFVILIILCLALVFAYYYFVLNDSIYRDNYANQMIGISDNNENTIFSIQKVVLYSNANAIDNSKDQSLSDVSICQYSDLGISIDNSQSSSELNYKNPFSFGKYKEIESPINNRIDFKIVSTNKENESNNYDEPTFFTDCSNPINLGYLNKDLLTKYSVSNEASTVSFNGKVLKEANISLDDINYNLKFTIHIVNNLNEKFSYNMNLDVNLDGIYDGYTYRAKSTSGNEYRFFRE